MVEIHDVSARKLFDPHFVIREKRERGIGLAGHSAWVNLRADGRRWWWAAVADAGPSAESGAALL